MKCTVCGGEELYGVIQITKVTPLAKRGDTIKIGGMKISQIDVKNMWDKEGGQEGGSDRAIKGPIQCGDCGAELFTVKGSKNNPYVGKHADALKKGAQYFLDDNTLESDD